MCLRCAVSRCVLPEYAEARLRLEQGWPSGMPCCRVWCRLEMIFERSLSRLEKGKQRRKKEKERERKQEEGRERERGRVNISRDP